MNETEMRAQWFAKRDKVQAEAAEPKESTGNRSKYCKYPDLIAAFLPAMKKHGLDIIHGEKWHEQSQSWIITMSISDRQTGWAETDSYYIINEANTNQGHGGAQTYGKRYMFANLIGFQFGEEDDDGEHGRQAAESKEAYISTETQRKLFAVASNLQDKNAFYAKLRSRYGVQDLKEIPKKFETDLVNILEGNK